MARKLDELNIAFYKRLKEKENCFNSSLPVLWFFVIFCFWFLFVEICLEDCLRLSLSEALEDRGNHVRLFEAFLCWKNEGTHENCELHRSELIVEVIFPMTGRPEHLHLPLEMVLQENALTSWIAECHNVEIIETSTLFSAFICWPLPPFERPFQVLIWQRHFHPAFLFQSIQGRSKVTSKTRQMQVSLESLLN